MSTRVLPQTHLRDHSSIYVEEMIVYNSDTARQSSEALTRRSTVDSHPWLIASFYTEPEHQLNLNTLDIQNQLLAQALTELTFATPEYAKTPYQDALNWSTVFDKLKKLLATNNQTWTKLDFYVVEFRSKLKAQIDNALLFKLDKESHREATASGGLLKYWYGEPNAHRANLATCLWRSKEDAVAGGKGPWHRQARAIIPQMYESINIKGLKLTIEDDVTGWKFEPWSE